MPSDIPLRCPHCHNDNRLLIELMNKQQNIINIIKNYHCENCSKDWQVVEPSKNETSKKMVK